MSRPCKVCVHPQSREIEKQIAKQTSYRDLSEQFGLSPTGISNHVKNCIPAALEAARTAQKVDRGMDVEAELKRVFRRLGKLIDACDEWLTDPDDAEKYSLEARATELNVIYEDFGDTTDQGKPKRKRDLLSTLLAKVEGLNIEIGLVMTKKADPRDLIVKTAGEIKGQLELYAKLNGLLQRDRVNDEDRRQDRENIAKVKAEVARLLDAGWSDEEARAILLEAEPEASKYLQ